MKILIVMTPAFNSSKGGVQRITEKLGRYFCEEGNEVLYYCFNSDDQMVPSHGTLHHAPTEGAQFSKTNLDHLATMLSRLRPDVVLNQMPYEKTITDVLVKSKRSTNYLLIGCLNNSLYSVKNNLSHYTRKVLPGFLHRAFDNRYGHRVLFAYHKFIHSRDLKLILDDYDYFVLPTDSPASREELKYFVGDYLQEKVFGIPNSIPAIDFNAESIKEKVVLYVGRLNDGQKRSDLLLKVWKKIQPILPEWEFDIVGDGPYRSHLERQISTEQIKNVALHGVQNPEPYYQKSTIFIMPSAFEGFPSVLLEAQSQGVVPVAFNSYPALASIVGDKVSSELVDPYDVDKMAGVIYELATNKERLGELMMASVENAKRFTIDKVGKQWLDFFTERVRR